MSAMVDTLGGRLRHARELVPADAIGGTLSSRELGALAGISAGLVSAIELGERDNPTLDTLRGLCVALGVDLSWLADGSGMSATVDTVRRAVERSRATRHENERQASE